MHSTPASAIPSILAFGNDGIRYTRVVLTLLLVALVVPMSDKAVAQTVDDSTTTQPVLVEGKEVAHWSGLPIWGAEEAQKHGYDLPLPIGLSANVFYEQANFGVPKVTVGGRSGSLANVGGLIRVPNVYIQETATTMRFDAWVLPFLDLYAVGGYVTGHGDVKLRSTLTPIPNLDFRLNFNGPTVGVGGTLAAGFRPMKERDTILFGLTDLNFTRTSLDFSPIVTSLDAVDVVVFSTRVGVRERIARSRTFGDVNLSVWGGAMYQGVQEDMVGSVSILDLNFQANVEAVEPWNAIIGGRLEIGKNLFVTAEAGLGDRKSLMLALAVRF